jgi:hypothetical protein
LFCETKRFNPTKRSTPSGADIIEIFRVEDTLWILGSLDPLARFFDPRTQKQVFEWWKDFRVLSVPNSMSLSSQATANRQQVPKATKATCLLLDMDVDVVEDPDVVEEVTTHRPTMEVKGFKQMGFQQAWCLVFLQALCQLHSGTTTSEEGGQGEGWYSYSQWNHTLLHSLKGLRSWPTT